LVITSKPAIKGYQLLAHVELAYTWLFTQPDRHLSAEKQQTSEADA
jgi:hypothetical protein